jgi:hypothetical protein
MLLHESAGSTNDDMNDETCADPFVLLLPLMHWYWLVTAVPLLLAVVTDMRSGSMKQGVWPFARRGSGTSVRRASPADRLIDGPENG